MMCEELHSRMSSLSLSIGSQTCNNTTDYLPKLRHAAKLKLM